MKRLSQLGQTLILSTVLQPENVESDWWYLGVQHGQHIQFHTRKSLELLASHCGLKLTSQGDLHLFHQKKRVPEIVWGNLERLYPLLKLSLNRRLKSKVGSDYLSLTEKAKSGPLDLPK